jgi:hypothetical protein
VSQSASQSASRTVSQSVSRTVSVSVSLSRSQSVRSTQTDSQTDTDLSDLPPAKRLRTDSGNVLYGVSDHRSSQQEIVSEDNFAILHDLLSL